MPTDKAQAAGLVTKLGFNVEKFYAWAKQHEDEKGWINVAVWKSGKTFDHYAALDEWKPSRDLGIASTSSGNNDDRVDSIPF